MHALPLLAALVDPFEIIFRTPVRQSDIAVRFGDEPNPEARLFHATRNAFGLERPRRISRK